MEVELPKDLEERYHKIRSKFNSISGDWKKYADEIIPEDKEFAKEIITFIIETIEYMEENFDNINLINWSNFLYFYELEFYYGAQGDDRNYLSFDEGYIMDIIWEVKLKPDKPLSKEKLKLLKTKLIELKNRFE